jgi:hypothetical protein
MCVLHAVNNVFGAPILTVDDFKTVCVAVWVVLGVGWWGSGSVFLSFANRRASRPKLLLRGIILMLATITVAMKKLDGPKMF